MLPRNISRAEAVSERNGEVHGACGGLHYPYSWRDAA
jgi:hypothetical protein